jgi:hypothetical protein
MQNAKNKQAANTVKTVSNGVANVNLVTFNAPASGWVTGSGTQTWVTNNAANNASSVIVQPTALGTSFISSLPIPTSGLNTNAAISKYMQQLHAANNGFFCTNTTVRLYQLLCCMLGVVPNTGKRGGIHPTTGKKGYGWQALQNSNSLATLGGSNASRQLGHIVNAIKNTGGIPLTGTIAGGNTLAMLLTGSNSQPKKHALFGKPLVTLSVSGTVNSK